MSARTVDWTATGTPDGGPAQPPKAEGLRERKKRLMRQQLSDTATEMFVERGFDAVRVAEIAEACGVSEKTVFNYFPTKESLVMDRFDTTMDSLRTGLAEPEVAPVQAALRILASELNGMVAWLESQQDAAETIAKIQSFSNLIQSTPALRAYQRDVRDQLIDVAADALAERAGTLADAPETRIAAPAWAGSSWAASHNVMASSSPPRISSAAWTGGIPGSASPVRSEAIVASSRSRISDSLVGK